MEPKQHPNDAEIAAKYEAPAIEEVVTPTDLAREVHYAGFAS